MVLETESEGLMARDLEGILEQESPRTRTKIVPVFPPDLPGTKSLFPAGPPIRLGGTLSGYPYFNVQENGALDSKDIIHVNQVSKIAAATAKKQKMVQEVPLKIKKRSAVPTEENNSLFLILPSYAAKHKVRIRQILSQEKEKLCNSKHCNKIFSDVNFKIAYTNDRSIKNVIARTKLKLKFCISGVFVHKLEGVYCDHGNKLMWRIL